MISPLTIDRSAANVAVVVGGDGESKNSEHGIKTHSHTHTHA